MVVSKIQTGSTAGTFESINPATKQSMGRAPLMGEAEVNVAIEKSWKTFEHWQLTSYSKRAKLILKFRQTVANRADEIAALISEEVGKPLPEAYLSELSGPLDTCVWLAENCERLLGDQPVPLANPLLSSKQSIIAFEPLGVVGIISPWNYPFAIPTMTALMAIMVGNTVLLKPSEKSPLVGIKIGELFNEAGFPDGVIQILTGDSSTGKILSQGNLSKLIFTGSVEAGSQVMTQASARLTPVTLELGGKDAAIVLPDAPVDWTARGLVWGAFTNAGQACASVERVYIVKGKNSDKLIDTIVAMASKLKLGPATDPMTDVGPLIDQGQLDHVISQVEEAVRGNAKCLTGGHARTELGGFFFEPTVIAGVNNQMKIMRDETFGPVMPIMIVDSEDQAVELANDSEYGLTATVWAGKLNRAECVARDLNVGTVLINDCLFSHATPQLPWGGIKKSGFGKGHSYFGLQDLCNIKHISIDAAGGAHRVWWYPYSNSKIKMAQGGIQLMHGKLSKRTAGLVNFVGNMFTEAPKQVAQIKKLDETITAASQSESDNDKKTVD